MHQTPAPNRALSALEISGAISARVIHDLSNLITGIIGNAEFVQERLGDEVSMRKAVEGISLSANNAGKLLGQCLPLQKLLASEAFPCEAGEQAVMIADGAGLAPGWRIKEPLGLSGKILTQPRWLAASIWQIVRETDAAHGEIEFTCGPAIFPVVWRGSKPSPDRPGNLFQILLSYRADSTLFSPEGPVSPERLGLLAAHELIRRFKGQIQPRANPPGRQEISVLLPLL